MEYVMEIGGGVGWGWVVSVGLGFRGQTFFLFLKGEKFGFLRQIDPIQFPETPVSVPITLGTL